MSEYSLERAMSYRLASAYDCWGTRRELRAGRQHGLWLLDGAAFDLPPVDTLEEPIDAQTRRAHALAAFRASGRFTTTELSTIEAIVDGLTLEAIAERDGCTRQAVLARIVGNSRGQGGILKKARYLLTCAL